MHYVEVEATVWTDEFGRHIRFAVAEAGVSVQLSLLPTEDTDMQATTAMQALMQAPNIMSHILDLHNADMAEDE